MLIRHLLGQGEAPWLQLGGGALSLAVFRVLCAVNFNLGMILIKGIKLAEPDQSDC